MRLATGDIKERLRGIDGWKLRGDAIQKTYTFRDFRQSIAFVNAVADAAEAMDHHPNIEIKDNTVSMTLSTHSEGGLTENDFALATQIDAAANGVPGGPA
jgi:4a-hydroxytetrahydrobiopterin dehydratase